MPVAPERDDSKHVPQSHPVLARVRQRIDQRRSLPPGPSEMAEMTARLDFLASIVAQLPDHALTDTQCESVRIIARELLRRSA